MLWACRVDEWEDERIKKIQKTLTRMVGQNVNKSFILRMALAELEKKIDRDEREAENKGK